MLFPDRPVSAAEVERIARKGAERARFHFRKLRASEVSEKARNDHVTIADREAEECILDAITDAFPDHRVLAEESGWGPSEGDSPLWIVDPLDGTTNFIHGIAHFAVSIGVVVNDNVCCGVIYDPIKEDCFSFSRGSGLTWNGRPVTPSLRESLAGSLLATGFPFKAHDRLDDFLAIFRETFLRAKAIRRTGSAALDLAYTAVGIYDGVFEFGLAPWDLAAGVGMVREIGGTVIDMKGADNKDPLRVLRTGDVLCGSPGIVTELYEIIKAILP